MSNAEIRNGDAVELGSLVREIKIVDSQLRKLIKSKEKVRPRKQNTQLVLASGLLQQALEELTKTIAN